MRDLSRRRARAGIAVVIAAALAVPTAAQAAVDETLLVSRADGVEGEGAESFAADVSISDDGCRMTFNTTADNIAPTDPTAGQNVVMRDACEGTTENVAIDEVSGDPADEFNSTATISGDGCRIAFWTTDSLHPDDPDLVETPNGFPADEGSVYVRDVCLGWTILASRDDSGNSIAAVSQRTSISKDGNRVAFSTGSHVEVQGGVDDNNPEPGGLQDVYIRDMDELDPDSGTTTLASVKWDGSEGANGDSAIQTEARQALSDDGRFISMYTTATDLQPPSASPADTNGREDIYVRDLQAGVAQRATLTDDEGQLTGAPGRIVTAFTWAISGDGRHIAWWGNSPELPGGEQVQVYLRDLDAGTTELISRASGPEGDISNTGSARPALDETGRLVAFTSGSTNLATNVNGAQVYVRDTLNQTTHAISRKSGHLGELSTGASITEDVAFSDDSRFAAFASSSPDLAPGDANGGDIDVFRRELNEPPSPRTQVSFNARPIVSGATVDLPGPGGGPQPLGTIRQLPVGTVVDATQGRIAATTTGTSQSKPVQTAEFYGGRFTVTQRNDTLVLMQLKPPKCKRKGKKRKGAKGRSAGAPLARAAGRRSGLWGSGRGRFGTRGGRGAGTVRGTIWFVEDRCKGSTYFQVTQGTLAIDDFGRKGKVNKILQAPGTYVAKPAPRSKRTRK